MQRIAGRLAGFFAARGYLDPEQREVAAYGFDLLIYTLLSTLGLLLAGAVLGRGVQAALIVGLFYLNQTFGGGFHARTHLRCFATMLQKIFIIVVEMKNYLHCPKKRFCL